MNFKIIFYILGHILKIEALLMVFPLAIAVYNRDDSIVGFLVTMILLLITGILLSLKKPAKTQLYAKEGFCLVGLAWISMSAFGALPLYLSGEIPSFTDAMFEMVSGFTTTGSTILTDIELLPLSSLFWRSFSNWIGGMGVLVFVLAVLPQAETQSMHIMRAEVSGPAVGKIVSKVKFNARIMYGIYIAMTIILMILYMLGGMPLFDSIVHSFSTAGTGGFSIKNASIGYYGSPYLEYLTAIFMLLFSVNFNVYYLILLGNFKDVIKSEEMRWFFGIVLSAVVIVTINISTAAGNALEALRYALFQISSVISTTGYSTTDFNTWPNLSRNILLLLMFVGACAGSTGGGIKISRLLILVKNAAREVKRIVNPRSVSVVKLEGKRVDDEVISGAHTFLTIYLLIIAFSTVILSIDFNDFETCFTAVITCINNIGPGFGGVGPISNFHNFSFLSKWVLIFDMLSGRLEIYPILILLNPNIYKRLKRKKSREIDYE